MSRNNFYKIILLSLAIPVLFGLRVYLDQESVHVNGSGQNFKESVEGEPEETSQLKVNLNTGSKDDLMKLPGIGEKTAKSILSYKEKHGPFQTVDSIIQVKGIGPKTFKKIEPLITVK